MNASIYTASHSFSKIPQLLQCRCLLQGSVWDAVWAHDNNYIATVTHTGNTEEAGERGALVAAVLESAPSVLTYWRREGSKMCSVLVGHEVAKLVVDPGNTAYVVTLGTAGKVCAAAIRVQHHRLCHRNVPHTRLEAVLTWQVCAQPSCAACSVSG